MKKYFYPLLVVLGWVACNPINELGTPFQKGQEVTLTANIGEQHPQMLPGMQRISGEDTYPTDPSSGEIALTWDKEDQILVKVGNEEAKFSLTAGAGSGNGTFTGSMPANGNRFNVQYPTFIPNLSEQQYVQNGFGKDLMLMTTKKEGTIDGGFLLSADYALLGLQLTGNGEIGKIVLYRNMLEDNTSKDGEETESYTLLCPNVMLSADPTLFYIVVLPGEWKNGFTVEVFAKDKTTVLETFKKTSSITFETENAAIMPKKHVQNPPKRIGVFSVGNGKYVSFSQGNLQHTQSTDTWQFAKEQYEYIGKDNITNGQLGQIIDMFGWSADADPANKWGVTIAKEGFDGDFVDWGLNYIHGEAPGLWRTLSQDEWSYLLSCRQHATELWGVAQVAGVNGVIILPDRWSPTDGLPFVAGINENGYAAQQTLSVEQWQLMEELGAVFLPAAGGRDGASLAFSHIDSVGWYWLSTPTDPGKASCVRFECNLMVQRNGWRQAGLSVRLVHDTIVPEAVDLGLSVKWASFNVGATSPEDFGDYFAWGETKPKKNYTWDNYKFGNNTDNLTKYNAQDQLTTLLPEDDAVHVNWGNNWRMPTEAEYQELINNITSEWVTDYNGTGVSGRLFSAENGNTLFLPAAGIAFESQFLFEYSGSYWTASLNQEYAYQSYNLYIIGGEDEALDTYSIERFIGFPIRGVKEANK